MPFDHWWKATCCFVLHGRRRKDSRCLRWRLPPAQPSVSLSAIFALFAIPCCAHGFFRSTGTAAEQKSGRQLPVDSNMFVPATRCIFIIFFGTPVKDRTLAVNRNSFALHLSVTAAPLCSFSGRPHFSPTITTTGSAATHMRQGSSGADSAEPKQLVAPRNYQLHSSTALLY